MRSSMVLISFGISYIYIYISAFESGLLMVGTLLSLVTQLRKFMILSELHN